MLATMLAETVALLRAHTRPLGFGFLVAGLSSFGQTYFIALTNAGMRTAFGVSDGALGIAYAGATLASGLLLAWAGRTLDRWSPRACAVGVGLALALACALAALAPSLPVMALAFFLLRFLGQGLMPHIALTTTARGFAQDRGKALGIVALGFAAGEAVLPPVFVVLAAAAGWRAVWWGAAALVLAGVALAWRLAPPDPSPAPLRGGVARRDPFWRDRRTVLIMPAILTPPFVITIFFFHQVRLAEELGWSLGVIAAGFTGMALLRAWAMIQVGPVIDRVGAVRLLPVFLLPLGVGLAAILAGATGQAAAIVYLLAVGLTSGVSTTVSTAVWAELFGTARLGAIRAAAAGAGVIASAVAPALSGLLLDAGVTLWWQALGCLTALLAASALTLPVVRSQGRGT